nr:coiled-coil alpha-helical rod protein 1-like [Nerophis lumbriciformis]
MIPGNNTGRRTPEENVSDFRTRSKERGNQRPIWEEEWCLEAQRQKAEAERLKEPMEALKNTLHKYREEITIKNDTISRQCHHLETIRQEMSQVKAQHSHLKEELKNCQKEKAKIISQLEKSKKQSDEVLAKMRREASLNAETVQKQVEEAEERSLKMSEKIQQMQKKHEEELRQLTGEHYGELCTAQKLNHELQSKLESVTRELLQLKSNLSEASAERDEFKERLSQMKQAYETQSATLHSLRNYIGKVVADKEEKERSNEAVERLNKEKAALQKTTELLTVRLNSMSEIVSLQEEKMLKKASTDPLVAKNSDGLLVLHLWREKVFKLCVQLRLKDVGLREERGKHLSEVRLMEQQLQEEHHHATVLQRSLDASVAELNQEKLQKETLKQDLTHVCKENQELKSKHFNVEAEIKTATEAMHGFNVAFHRKMADVNAAQAKLNTFSQRLNFARGRVETVQALFMRRIALHKVQKTSKQAERAVDSIQNLQIELSLVSEEKLKLTQELKKTPELIEEALADMKEEYESKLRQQQEELEQCRNETQKAVSGREEVQQNLRDVLAQLEVGNGRRDELQSKLLSQKEHSEQVLRERLSEMESCCAEKLKEMEVQLSTVKKEHTKAVLTLRQLERAVARKQNHWRETEALQSGHTKDSQQTEEAETNRHKLLSLSETSPERHLNKRYLLLKNNLGGPSDSSTVFIPPERLLCVLEELHTLSAAVVNSSEDSAEEEKEGHSDIPEAVQVERLWGGCPRILTPPQLIGVASVAQPSSRSSRKGATARPDLTGPSAHPLTGPQGKG